MQAGGGEKKRAKEAEETRKLYTNITIAIYVSRTAQSHTALRRRSAWLAADSPPDCLVLLLSHRSCAVRVRLCGSAFACCGAGRPSLRAPSSASSSSPLSTTSASRPSSKHSATALPTRQTAITHSHTTQALHNTLYATPSHCDYTRSSLRSHALWYSVAVMCCRLWQDVLFINWFVQALVTFTSYGWYVWLVIPAYGLYQYGPMLLGWARMFMGGMGGGGGGGGGGTGEPTEADIKRQAKKERQADRASKFQGK